MRIPAALASPVGMVLAILVSAAFLLLCLIGVSLIVQTSQGWQVLSSDSGQPTKTVVRPTRVSATGATIQTQTASSIGDGGMTPVPVESLGAPEGTPAVLAPTQTVAGVAQKPPPIAPSSVDIEALLAQLNLEEKVGQMILSGLPGEQSSQQARQLINGYWIGGVVYFGSNTRSPTQTLQFSQDLQRLTQSNPHPIPLIVSIDHEGGNVFRFASGMTHFPSAMAIGATNNPELAYRAGVANAWELRNAGINASLGPVLDINDEPSNPVIGLRAIGGRADLVARLGSQYLLGLQDSGVIGVGKHFPGHGSTHIDSHNTLPVVNKSMEQLRTKDLIPFAEAVRNQVGMIMVGHIANLTIDPTGAPASLSMPLVQQLLRNELGYQGVAVTDALNMGAVTEHSDLPNAAVRAVQAGIDIIAVVSPDQAIGAHAAIVQAVRTGSISMVRIDQSVRRILLLKARFGLWETLDTPPPALPPGYGQEIAGQIAKAAVTAYQCNQGSCLALQAVQPGAQVLLISPSTIPPGSVQGDGISHLGELLVQGGLQVDEWFYPLDYPAQTAALQQQVLQIIDRYALTILVIQDAYLRLVNSGDEAQNNLIQALAAGSQGGRRPPLILAAVGLPYDLKLAPADVAGFATYGSLEIQYTALAQVLLGQQPALGAMPVDLLP